MENWIGVGIWIVMGTLIGLVMKVTIRRPEETAGHGVILVCLGAFGAVVGGMLGVGILEFYDPLALSLGGMLGAVLLSTLATWIYRWGARALV